MARNDSQGTACCSFCEVPKKEGQRLFSAGPTMICDACVDEAVIAKKKGTLHTNIGAACNCGFCDEVTPSAFVRQIDDKRFSPPVCIVCIDELEEQRNEISLKKKLEEALRNPTSQKQPLGMFFRQAADIFHKQGFSYPLAAKFLSYDLGAVRQVYNTKQPIRDNQLSSPTDTEYQLAVALLGVCGMDGVSARAVLTRPTIPPARPKPQNEDVSPRVARVQALS